LIVLLEIVGIPRIHINWFNTFSRFLKGGLTRSAISNTNLTLDTKIPALMYRNVEVYELLDQFVSYLSQLSIAVASVKLYIAAVRSFLEFSDRY